MKVCVKGIKEQNYEPELFKDFLDYLQSEMPLRDDVTIILTPNRNGKMTTGVSKPNEMIVLAGGRMLIDVLRTLSHEWVHEYQHQKMGVKESDNIPDIGGPIENMASVLASIFLKKFQNQFPNHEKFLYKSSTE